MKSRLEIIQGWRAVYLLAIVVLIAGSVRVEASDEGVVTGVVVDAAGKPVADVEVTARVWETSGPTRTDASGAFRLSVPRNPHGHLICLVVARDGAGRVGDLKLSGREPEGAPVRVVLRPSRSFGLRVVDGAGRPVQNAEFYFQVDLFPFAAGRTDAEGRWTGAVPVDCEQWSVYALKSKVGFDYAQAERARGSAEPMLPLPETMTLTLDGVRPPLSIRAEDPEGKPIAGVQVVPLILQKPDHETPMTALTDVCRKTGPDGYATFDWLPQRLIDHYGVYSRSPDYYHEGPIESIPADKPLEQVAIRLKPYVLLSGRVSTPEGLPAVAAVVTVSGSGVGNGSFRGTARTDEAGRYILKAYDGYAYIITASKDGMASPFRSDVVIRDRKPVEGADLVLARATRVKGRVTIGEDRPPAEPTSIRAIVDVGTVPDDLRPHGTRPASPLTMSLYATCNADGRYELLLGPGDYELERPGRRDQVKLSIPEDNPPLEIIQNFSLPRPEYGKLAVTVVDGDDRPVPGVVVDGAYQKDIGFFGAIRTNEQGRVQVRRRLEPMILLVATPDRSRAAVVTLDAEASTARLVLATTATAVGRLVDPQGKPIVDREIYYSVLAHHGTEPSATFSGHPAVATTTDEVGRFLLSGLIVGESYEIKTYDKENRRSYTAQIKVHAAEPIAMELGDVPIDLTPPKPYVPPTPFQRSANSFAERTGKSPPETLAGLLKDAKREYTRPLLLLGRANDAACIEFFRLCYERPAGDSAKDEAPRTTPYWLRWGFELASLDASQADVKTFAGGLGATPGADQSPILVVLSDEGNPLASYPLALGADGKVDDQALGTFMLAHKLPTRNAEAMISAGLAKAKAEGKSVFLDFGASWCPPCRRLGKFIDANWAELERHYVFVKLDVSRDDQAFEIQPRYEAEDTPNGVPWYVILDPDGKILIKSNRKNLGKEVFSTNIGFPSEKPGIDHLMTMFKQTAPRMSDETLAGLRKQLEKKP